MHGPGQARRTDAGDEEKCMALAIGVLMDPIGAIKVAKDSTFAMLLEAQRRGHRLSYATQGDLLVRDGRALARLRTLRVADDASRWYELGEPALQPLAGLDVLLARKDPPFSATACWS
jgi:glutathione synthase